MNFGKVENPLEINFSLPPDSLATQSLLQKRKSIKTDLNVFVGCAKWDKKELKGFYPKGTKDELTYYASIFNSIELNATFYNMPSLVQTEKWKGKVPTEFRFCPKITNTISHFRRLVGTEQLIEQFCNAVAGFGDNLGTVFLQLHDNYHPKDIDKLSQFLQHFPIGIPLAVEVRNHNWISDASVFAKYTDLLERLNITNIIVDTAGRRDLLHMHLTNTTAFVRFVGANIDGDYERLDQWVERIAEWKKDGLETLYFFIHQNVEESSTFLAAHFIKALNERIGTDLVIPHKENNPPNTLF